jgi:hypothetical protein
MRILLAWITDHWKSIAIWTPFVLLVLYVGFCRPKRNPIPSKEQRTIDSLSITKPAFDSTQLARSRAETVYVAQSAHEARRGAQSAGVADSLREIANALQRQAEAEHDTVSTWRAVALAREREADTLRSALSTTARALDLQISARQEADARASASETAAGGRAESERTPGA